MPSGNWKDIAELFGIGAIVASLIFVGLQMQQSQEIAVGAQYQERANAAIENYMSQIQSDQALRNRGQRLINAASSGSYPIVIKNLIETEGNQGMVCSTLAKSVVVRRQQEKVDDRGGMPLRPDSICH